MYPKYKVEKLIKLLGPSVADLLGIQSWDIRYKVQLSTHSDGKWQSTYAHCYTNSNKKKATIVIHYDKQTSYRETVGSIIHELLHVAFASYRKSRRKDQKEESLVLALENLIVKKSFKTIKRKI